MNSDEKQTPDQAPPPNLIPQLPQDQLPQQPIAPEVPVQSSPEPVPSSNTYEQAPIQLPIVQQKSSKKPLFVGLGVFGGVLALIGIAFAVYFFGVRVPDTEYVAALSSVQTITADTKKLEKQAETVMPGLKGVDALPSTSVKQDVSETEIRSAITEINKQVESCTTLLKQLESSAAVSKDTKVKDAYATAQTSVSKYCGEIGAIGETGEIVLGMVEVSQDFAKNMNAATTKQGFDKAGKSFKDFIAKHPTVPYKAFNDAYYVPATQLILDVIQASSDVIEAAEEQNLTKFQAATKKLNAISDRSEMLQKKADSVKLEMPQLPTKELADLESVIGTRKQEFFRL